MTLTLPQQWQTHVSDDITHFVKIDSGKKEEMCQVSTSLSIHLDGTWSVFFVGHKIPKTNMSLGKFPNNITSIDVINQLIFVLNHASLCPGNSEEKYIDVCKRRKDEKISGERGFGETVGYIDVRNSHGKNITIEKFNFLSDWCAC